MPRKLSLTIPEDLDDDRVLSYPQVTEITGRSADSIRRAAARRELKVTRLGPRCVGVRKSELRRWLDACTA
jgi:predicted DNA-binding transcriptional regulator AlpA